MGDVVRVVLVRTYKLPCGHTFVRKDKETFPLAGTELGGFFICASCGKYAQPSKVVLTEHLESIDE